MPDNSCNPKNVMGKLAGVLDAGGIEIQDNAFRHMSDNAKLLYAQVTGRQNAGVLKEAKPDADFDKELAGFWGGVKNESMGTQVKSFVTSSLKPTDLFGEDATKPILDFIDDFATKEKSFKDYKSGIKSAIAEAESIGIKDWAQGEWAHWKRDLLEGHPFWTDNIGAGSGVASFINNTSTAAMDLSATIITGNPVELMVKAPALYGIRPSLMGVLEGLKATKGNPWGKIPELEARGLYGYQAEKNVINKILRMPINIAMDASQRPFLNTVYGIAKAAGKDPMTAIEKIAYMNRLGNIPRAFRNQKSASSLRLMNFTISQYQMFYGMGHTLMTKPLEGARQIATYTAIAGLAGGGASLIPAPVSAVLSKIDGYKEWEQEHINPIGRLMQPNAVALGAAQSIATRTWDAVSKDLANGVKDFSNGDVPSGATNFALAGLTLSSGFKPSIINNPKLLTTARKYIDLLQGDIDQQEFEKSIKDKWLPFAK